MARISAAIIQVRRVIMGYSSVVRALEVCSWRRL